MRGLLESEHLVGRCLTLPMGRSLPSRIRAMQFLIKALRQQDYRRAFLFHPSDRYAVALGLAGIPRIYGFGGALQNLFLQKSAILPEAERKAFILERSLGLVKKAGLAPAETVPSLHPDPQAISKIRESFASMPKPLGCHRHRIAGSAPRLAAGAFRRCPRRALGGWL